MLSHTLVLEAAWYPLPSRHDALLVGFFAKEKKMMREEVMLLIGLLCVLILILIALVFILCLIDDINEKIRESQEISIFEKVRRRMAGQE